MPPGRPADYAEVVRAHRKETTGYVVAASARCLALRDTEIAAIERQLQALRPEDLGKLEPSGSWLVGVLLCPGDGTEHVAKWTRALPAASRGRVRFYYVDGCDLVAALAAWYEADLDDPAAVEVTDFASFHRRFGLDLNDRIYEDSTAEVPP